MKVVYHKEMDFCALFQAKLFIPCYLFVVCSCFSIFGLFACCFVFVCLFVLFVCSFFYKFVFLDLHIKNKSLLFEGTVHRSDIMRRGKYERKERRMFHYDFILKTQHLITCMHSKHKLGCMSL